MTEPTTQAGRAVLTDLSISTHLDESIRGLFVDLMAERIAAIEAEAHEQAEIECRAAMNRVEAEAVERWIASSDAERRLAAALRKEHGGPRPWPGMRSAEDLANGLLAALRENPDAERGLTTNEALDRARDEYRAAIRDAALRENPDAE